jgi:hypothetical protein
MRTVDDLKPLRSEIARMADELFSIVGIPFEQTTELQRQLLASFGFGMLFAVGQIKKLSPPEVQALAILLLMDVFKYSAQQAGEFTELLIDSSSGGRDATIKSIIHGGIDGHRQWQAKQVDELRRNIKGIFAATGA